MDTGTVQSRWRFSQTTNRDLESKKSFTVASDFLCNVSLEFPLLSKHGISEKVLSDNGPQYSSKDFKEFAGNRDFVHQTSSPYYSKTNGMAKMLWNPSWTWFIKAIWVVRVVINYGDFSIFQDGGRRHLGLLKFRFFNGRVRHECQTASPCQISSKSLEPRPIYVSFNIMRVWLENAYSRPFLGFFGSLTPLCRDYRVCHLCCYC